MSDRLRSTLITVAILIGGFVIMKVLNAQKEIPKRMDSKKMEQAYQFQEVNPTDIPTYINIGGIAQAYHQIDVYAEVSGLLQNSHIPFRTGSRFNKGDVLLKIDDRVYHNNVLAQKSSLLNQLSLFIPDLALDYPESAEKWNKYLESFSFDVSLPALPEPENSKEKYFIASRNIYNLFYSVKSMEETLAKYTIYAPFAGVVTESNITPGTLTRAGQMLGEFTNTDLYEIEVPTNVNDLKYIHSGDKVVLTSDDISGSFNGVVKRVNDKIERSSQTVKVYIHSSDKHIKDGMYVSARIEAEPITNAVKIPAKWVDDGHIVYLRDGEDLSPKEIKIVRNENDFVILRGLEEGMFILAQEKAEI